MTSLRIILRGLAYHWRAHIGGLGAAAIGSAVLVGALVVGSSVRETLRHQALQRLGKIEASVSTGERLFRASLVSDIQESIARSGLGQPTPVPAAPVLQLAGVASTSDSTARANHVEVLGVDGRFWQLANEQPKASIVPEESVVLNRALAAQLKVEPGAQIILRVPKPTALSRDAPLSPEEDSTLALRLRVHAIVSDNQLGAFSLRSSQVPALNAFVPLAWLQRATKATNRANLMLFGGLQQPAAAVYSISPTTGQPVRTIFNLQNTLTNAIQQRWALDDAQLAWSRTPDGVGVELRSPRVFLDDAVGDAIFPANITSNTFPARLASIYPTARRVGVLTYLVNELRLGDRATPYSMVTAADEPIAPQDLGPDEIAINTWLADDLGAKPGDEIALSYYVVGSQRQLEERKAAFKVKSILPMNAAAMDRSLMPDFPGLTDAASCREWDTGLPIRTDRIRDKDETYWKQYRGTPKAIIRLDAGQRLWANRFGSLTSVRILDPTIFRARSNAATSTSTSAPGAPASVNMQPEQWRMIQNQYMAVHRLLLSSLDPSFAGLSLQPVRDQAIAASSGTQDFGSLFLGFSFFIVLAALLLLALVFRLGLEKRATEIGTLLAVGLGRGGVSRLLLGEGMALAAIGAAAGLYLGVAYAKLLLQGLATIWNAAIGGASINLSVTWDTLAIGYAAGILTAGITLAVTLRSLARLPASELLNQGAAESALPTTNPRWWKRIAAWIAAIGLIGAVALALMPANGSSEAVAGQFFGAGALALIGGIALARDFLARPWETDPDAKLRWWKVSLRGITRRHRRSLAVIGLLSSGAFLIFSLGAFRLDAGREAQLRASGTGGFALLGETAQPIVEDLDSQKGREAHGLDPKDLLNVSTVPFRLREGDEASCLNLNRPQQPRILGVRPALLDQRNAFQFVEVAPGLPKDHPWQLLAQRPGKKEPVPAVVDQASMLWALGKKIGDTIEVRDDHGQPFKIRLVAAVGNSILQGSIVIGEDEFISRFPSQTGYRVLLLDAPPGQAGKVAETLTRGLRDLGLEVVSTVDRLNALNAVQNTYLGTFQVLGGMGLLLGTFGLGLVVLRNVLERRSEFALLQAVGIRVGTLANIVFFEHMLLLFAGLSVGAFAAALSVAPGVIRHGNPLPSTYLFLTLLAVLLNGALWTWASTRLALRGRLMDALRSE